MNHKPIDPSPIWSANYNESPKEVFTRTDIFEAELERIFYGDEWHPAATVGEIPNAGDFKTFSLGEVPLLIARAADNTDTSVLPHYLVYPL